MKGLWHPLQTFSFAFRQILPLAYPFHMLYTIIRKR